MDDKEIGGYLDISANTTTKNNKINIINHQYALNAARYCLEYIIVERGYNSIWLPNYGCHTLFDVANRLKINVNRYNIDKHFSPMINEDIGNTPVLYINYYGLMTNKCNLISKLYETVIIDNAQALYSPPIKGTDCIYSPRKFFALPDGGFIIPGMSLKVPSMEIDVSYNRMEHIFRRVDCGASDAYAIYVANRKEIASSSVKKMSKLTQLMLSQVDMQYAAKKRKENWNALQMELCCLNELSLELNENDVPLFYPFLHKNDELRQNLNKQKIYTPMYWNGVETHAHIESFDMYLYRYMHPLTVDQRYSIDDMIAIASIIKKILI